MGFKAKDIFENATLRHKPKEIEEWGFTINICEMTQADYETYAEQTNQNDDELSDLQEGIENALLLIVFCCRNGEMERVFSVDDIPAIKEKTSQARILELAGDAMNINKMRVVQDPENENEDGETEKNVS